MRGTIRFTNKAITTPILVVGCERKLFILTMVFWVWAFFGIFPHWPAIFVLLLMVINMYGLRFIAKQDPDAANVFKANSKFLLGTKVFVARGTASNLVATKKLACVPVSISRRV